MKRQITYYGAIVRALDMLLTNQNAMVGIAKLAEAVIGTGPAVSGFTVTPTQPAGLSVVLTPGQIYEVENLEEAAVSLLSPDVHNIVKQGLLLDPATITLAPPATVGYSVNALVEVQYADNPTGNTLLSYGNAANPQQPFSGPGNNGQQQATQLDGIVSYQIKYGTPAASGTQVTPAPDAGWVGLFVVTVSYGQTSITAGNISQYLPSSFIPTTLMGLQQYVVGLIQSTVPGQTSYGASPQGGLYRDQNSNFELDFDNLGTSQNPQGNDIIAAYTEQVEGNTAKGVAYGLTIAALATIILQNVTATEIFNITNQGPPGSGRAGTLARTGYMPTGQDSSTLSTSFTAPCAGTVTGTSILISTPQNGFYNTVEIDVNGTVAATNSDSIAGLIINVAAVNVNKGDNITIKGTVGTNQAAMYNTTQRFSYTFIPS